MSFYKKISVLLILSFPLFFIFCFCALELSKRKEKDLSEDPRWSHLVEMELIPKKSLILLYCEEQKTIKIISPGTMSFMPKSIEEYNQLKESNLLDKKTKDYGKCIGLLNEDTRIKIIKIVEVYDNMFGPAPDMRAEILSGEFKGVIISLDYVSQGNRWGTSFSPYKDFFSIANKPRKKPENLNEDAFPVNPYAKTMKELGDQYVSEYLDNSENEQEK